MAPYEADSQLTYLQNEGIVDFVITEDSDLLVFGCERVLFKLDDAGNGKLIELKELGKANKGLVVSECCVCVCVCCVCVGVGVYLCTCFNCRGLLKTLSVRCVYSLAVTTSPPCLGLVWGSP